MIKTTVKPTNSTLVLNIPGKYIGKEIEILLYTKEEAEQEISTGSKTMAAYKGSMSVQDAESFQEYLKQSREEWDRNI